MSAPDQRLLARNRDANFATLTPSAEGATDDFDPFALGGRSGETATAPGNQSAGRHDNDAVGMASRAGSDWAAHPPKETAMPDTHNVIAPLVGAADPIVGLLAERQRLEDEMGEQPAEGPGTLAKLWNEHERLEATYRAVPVNELDQRKIEMSAIIDRQISIQDKIADAIAGDPADLIAQAQWLMAFQKDFEWGEYGEKIASNLIAGLQRLALTEAGSEDVAACDVDKLRRGVAAIVSDFDLPLPDGDAGFAEAARRIPQLRARFTALYREFPIDIGTEDSEITPTYDRLESGLIDHLVETEPETLAGAATKLRFALSDNNKSCLLETSNRSVPLAKALLAFVERTIEAGSSEEAGESPDVDLTKVPVGEKVGAYMSFLDEHAQSPLTFQLADGTFRKATETELADHLRHRPWDTDHVAPDVLRRILPEADGEFFALLAERRGIQRESGYDDEGKIAQNLFAICETPVVTDAAVAMKLQLLMGSISPQAWDHYRKLSAGQQRQLTWNAIAWFYDRARSQPLEVRSLNVKELAGQLRGYCKDEAAR